MELKRYPDTIRLVDGTFAVSADFILREGKYYLYAPQIVLTGALPSTSYVIDTKGSGPYATNYRHILKDILARADEDDVIAGLRSKSGWDNADRRTWEIHLATIVSEEHAQNALLGKYRPGNLPEINEQRVAYDLNDVGNYRYVCTEMAITESMLLQEAERELLKGSEEDELKRIGQYFLIPGERWQTENAGHMWVASSLTGNIIESTNTDQKEGLPYKGNFSPDYTFDHLLAGYPAVTTWESVFVSPSLFFAPDTKILKGSEPSVIYTTQHEVAQSRLDQIPERLRLLRLGQFDNPQFTKPGTWYDLRSDKSPGIEEDRVAYALVEKNCVDTCDWNAIQAKLKEAGLPLHALDETIQNDEKPQLLPLPERTDPAKTR